MDIHSSQKRHSKELLQRFKAVFQVQTVEAHVSVAIQKHIDLKSIRKNEESKTQEAPVPAEL